MKQCPICKLKYTDESLSYCLEDGGHLFSLTNPETVQYNPAETQPSPWVQPGAPQPTLKVPPPPVQFASFNPTINPPILPAPQKSKSWLVFTAIGLLFVLASGGALAYFMFPGKVSEPQGFISSNENKLNNSNKPVNVVETKTIETPSPKSMPSASQMVGTWQTNVVENGSALQITYTFNKDGTSKAVFKDKKGRTETHHSGWRYSDKTLFEQYSDGSSGKGSIEWTDDDNFVITIIDNGVPAYNGLKRYYRRIK